MKPQFGSRPHPRSPERHPEAGAVQRTRSGPRISRRGLLPPLLHEELQGYDPRDTRLQLLMLAKMTPPASNRFPVSLLFRARSTEYLPRCHRKRCAPNRGEWILLIANTQNCDALTVQLIPMPTVPLQ